LSLDIDALERLAREATPGPWKASGPDVDMPGGRCAITFDASDHYAEPEDDQDFANARLIAALSPDVVLGLVARLRRAEGALTWIEQNAKGTVHLHNPDHWYPLCVGGGIALVARALSEASR
jgi:hypothetical protein